MGKIPAAAGERPSLPICPAGRSSRTGSPIIALGVQLRAYAFDRYKTKRKEGEERPAEVEGHDRGRRRRGGREGVRAAQRGVRTAW